MSHRASNTRRRGFIATGEVLFIVLVLMGLMIASYYALAVICGVPLDSRKNDVRPIYDILVDADEKHIWVNRLSEDIAYIDCDTGEVAKSLPTQGIVISALALNRDGSTAIVCAAHGGVSLFRDDEAVQYVNLAAVERLEAAVSGNCAVALGTVSCGRVRGVQWHGNEKREFIFDTGYHSDVLKIGFSSTLSRIFAARRDGSVSFYELETGKSDGATLQIGTDAVAVTWSSDERLLVSLSVDRTVRVYDVLTGHILSQGTLETPSTSISGAAILIISPDRRRIAVSTTHAPIIYIWDLVTGTTMGELRGHVGAIHAMQFSADSDRLFSGSNDGAIREWSLLSCSQLRLID